MTNIPYFPLERALQPKGRLLVPARGHVTHTRQALHYLAKLGESDSIGHPVWWVESRAQGIAQPVRHITSQCTTPIHLLIFEDGSALIRNGAMFVPMIFRLNMSRKKGPLKDRWPSLVAEVLTGIHDATLKEDSIHWGVTLSHTRDGFEPRQVAPIFRKIPPNQTRLDAENTLRLLLQGFLLTQPWIHSVNLRTGLIADFSGGWIIKPQLFWKGSGQSTDEERYYADSVMEALITLEGLYWWRLCSQAWQFSSLMGPLSHRKTGPTYRQPLTYTVGTLKRSADADVPIKGLSAHQRTALFQQAHALHPTFAHSLMTL